MSNKKILPSLDYIAGLVSISGSFMMITKNNKKQAVFQIKLKQSEFKILKAVKEKLKLKEKVYKYEHQKKKYTLLLVRSKETLENKIIPAFDNRLYGTKKKQFEIWSKKFLKRQIKKKYLP